MNTSSCRGLILLELPFIYLHVRLSHLKFGSGFTSCLLHRNMFHHDNTELMTIRLCISPHTIILGTSLLFLLAWHCNSAMCWIIIFSSHWLCLSKTTSFPLKLTHRLCNFLLNFLQSLNCLTVFPFLFYHTLLILRSLWVSRESLCQVAKTRIGMESDQAF